MRTSALILFFLSITAFSQTQPDEVFVGDLDAFLVAQRDAGFRGSVLVAKRNKIVLDKTYGAKGDGSTVAPTFWIASNSKSFAAVAIMRLQEQEKLSVRDPISKFFRNVPDDKHQITVHHLLTHTSGLPHRYASDGVADQGKAVDAILVLPLRSKPGESYRYSNDGYTLLAAIVEIAAKSSYEEYVRAEVIKRAGLKSTGFWGFEKGRLIAPVANIRNTESIPSTIYKDGRSVANWGYRGATGIYSTARDIYRWMTAIRDGKVLKRESVDALWGKQVTTEQIAPGEELFYGYGWGGRTKNGTRLYIRHSGNEDWLGHNGVMTLFEDGDAIIVLSNAGQKDQSSWGGFISREIHKRLQP